MDQCWRTSYGDILVQYWANILRRYRIDNITIILSQYCWQTVLPISTNIYLSNIGQDIGPTCKIYRTLNIVDNNICPILDQRWTEISFQPTQFQCWTNITNTQFDQCQRTLLIQYWTRHWTNINIISKANIVYYIFVQYWTNILQRYYFDNIIEILSQYCRHTVLSNHILI